MAIYSQNAHECDLPDPYHNDEWHKFQKEKRPKRYEPDNGFQRMEKIRVYLIQRDRRDLVRVDPDELFRNAEIYRARLIAGIWGNSDVALSEEAMALRYPLRDWGENGNSGELAPAHFRLSREDREFIERVIGGPLNLRTIECFLTENTKFPHDRIVGFEWPDIVEALRTYADKKPSVQAAGDNVGGEKNQNEEHGQKRKWTVVTANQALIPAMIGKSGLSLRQLEKLTGIPKSTIRDTQAWARYGAATKKGVEVSRDVFEVTDEMAVDAGLTPDEEAAKREDELGKLIKEQNREAFLDRNGIPQKEV